MIGGTLRTLRRLGGGLLAALLAVTIGTNILDFVTVPAAGARPGAGFAAAAVLRVVAVFWIAYAVQRRLAGGADPFRPGRALARFVALQILLLAGFAAATRLATVMSGPAPAPLATLWLYAFLATAGFALATIRLLAWNAALACGAPIAALGAIWRGQAPAAGAIAAAFVGLVLPVAAIHLALTLVAVRIGMAPGTKLTFAIVDGLVQALQLGLSCALGAVAWRNIGQETGQNMGQAAERAAPVEGRPDLWH